jgi:hypothetical protein
LGGVYGYSVYGYGVWYVFGGFYGVFEGGCGGGDLLGCEGYWWGIKNGNVRRSKGFNSHVRGQTTGTITNT